MRKALINVLMLIRLASHVLQISGKVTVLRGTEKELFSHPNIRKLMCFSEDDESALVWNDLIQEYYPMDRTSDRQFRSLHKFSNNNIDCELNAENSCLESWSRQNWSLTNSFKTPMSPVFDQRWESFKEYKNFEDKYDGIDLLTASAAAVSLSIRAPSDAHMLLCSSKDYNNDLCYWIIIGGWGNTLSVIRKCIAGVPRTGMSTDQSSKCKDEIVSVKHTPLSLTEWRTFVLTWDSATRNISVYDTNKIIMTYVDKEIPKYSSDNYHVFIRSDRMLIRFHIYNFLHTTLQSATLTSPVFQPDNETICIQLLIGLCAACDAHIVLRDITSYEVLQTVIVNGSSSAVIHGLSTWQSVKIEKSFSTNTYNNLLIQLTPKLNNPSSNPLWAIANIRQCSPNGSLRRGILYLKEDWTKSVGYFWPTVSCQKLSYAEHTIVNPMSPVRSDIKLDDANCPEGKIGPQCLFSCQVDLESNADCQNTTICYENGCTCPSGFSGSSCSDFLEVGEVLDLQRIPSLDSQLILMWRPVNQLNKVTLRYDIIIKVKTSRGCNDLKLPTPDIPIITKSTTNTTITILDLRPYTVYSVQVTIHNSRHKGAKITVEMKRLEIPTEVFSQLTMQDRKITWSLPEDCTVITGPIKARIKIRGISYAVQNMNIIKHTSNTYINLDRIQPPLNGFEQYIVMIYVIRDYNSPENISAYQEYIFKTPPTAPPIVTNLEVVEIDTRQSPATIHLRWQSPRPPVNGRLLNYVIKSCGKSAKHCTTNKIQLDDFCDLWDDYICGTVEKWYRRSQKIRVLAYNENVTRASTALITQEMLDNIIPDAPGEVTYTINSNSLIDLKWGHPWRTGGHLQSFRIQIIQISSDLREWVPRLLIMAHEYPVRNYTRNYNERLYLFPSSKYNIYIQAVTIANTTSVDKVVEVQTPSTTVFSGNLDVMVHKFDSTISLNIPSVMNDTRDSIMHIIVKGPHRCKGYSEVPENLREQIGMKMYEIAWRAAEVPTDELAGKLFTVGDDKIYGGARNCLLKPEEIYEITIIITSSSLPSAPITLATSIRIGDESSKHHEVWIIPVALVFVVAVAIIYFYQRRIRKLREQEEINLS